MKPAIIVVDMVKETFKEGSSLPITQEAKAFLPRLLRLLEEGRRRGVPIIFACDSYLREDFIFKGRLKPHSIRGTEGAEVWEELHPQPTDIFLPKRRFSAFFKTDLDQTLRTYGIDTIIVTGITIEFCVLTTAIDGVCHDFSAIIVEDCTASATRAKHEACLSVYRQNVLHPLLRIMTLEEVLREMA